MAVRYNHPPLCAGYLSSVPDLFRPRREKYPANCRYWANRFPEDMNRDKSVAFILLYCMLVVYYY